LFDLNKQPARRGAAYAGIAIHCAHIDHHPPMEFPMETEIQTPATASSSCCGRSGAAAARSDTRVPDATISLQPFREFTTLDEGRAALATLLNLPQPVDVDVLISAIEDPDYARNLIVSRNAPPFLNHLLAHPPKRANTAAENPDDTAIGNAALVGKAAKSLWAWAKSGLEMVSDEVYQHRLSACAQCPHHIEPPQRMVYKLAGATGRSVCDLCGCVTARKARLPHEACPSEDPERAGFSRWGEPKA
jgi:hypothetical protein